MVADFFTKPLQGKWFVQMRNIILNDSKIDDSVNNNEHRSMLDNIGS